MIRKGGVRRGSGVLPVFYFVAWMIVADVYFIIIDYAICIFIYISINAIFHYKINELFNGFET